MSRWGSVTVEGIETFYEKIQAFETNIDILYENLARECANRLLSLVVKRTPLESNAVNQCEVLRHAWTARNEQEAQEGISVKFDEYIQSLEVVKKEDSYEIMITNPVHYASDIEYGYKTKNQKWIDGHFMLAISENELKSKLPSILEYEIKKNLKEAEVFG